MSEAKKTVVVLIGNSDDKLSQFEWHCFVTRVQAVMESASDTIHFSGGAAYDKPWQNACWVAEVEEKQLHILAGILLGIRTHHRQDSIAMLVGDTTLI